MPEITIKLVIETNDAETTNSTAKNLLSDVKSNIEKPNALKGLAEQAFTTVRYGKIAIGGVIRFVSGVNKPERVNGCNSRSMAINPSPCISLSSRYC